MAPGTGRLTPLQKTLLITLRGRAMDAGHKRPILHDQLAAEIVERLDDGTRALRLPVGVREAVAIRSRMLDRTVAQFVSTHPDAVVVELGAGLETRRYRVDAPSTVDWYDVDFPEVTALRDRLLPHRDNVHAISSSLLDPRWVDAIPADRPTIAVSDGVLGFLSEKDNQQVLTTLTDHFTAGGELVFNAYTTFVARQNGRFTKIVGMPADFTGYGVDGPQDIVALNPALTFVEELFGDAAPERDELNLAYRLMARIFAAWPAQARRGVWIVRYRF